MFDIIVRSALDIVGQAERLIEAMRRMLQSEEFDEVEVYELDYEIERLGDVVFNVDEAVRSLVRSVEYSLKGAHVHAICRTLH
ncbi:MULTISPECIES: hypothetical protein [Rhizobium]|uniref:hypothetical protein n=1 Tax=Rhizobium TaxID=379 RepID=UPI00103F50F3|nr:MULTISPECIES: hypothetical protein [Rhizobium]MBY3380825.1 hypothetical protein [Rhizobium laguerreae]MDU0306089.1 hypothetical protein [Rhizobium sp. 10PS4]TBY12720.1 hypothetical protein E0J21_03695 [Rhizobium laguerreae]